ncbi:MAG: hypothetical protein ACFFD4_34515 [Candidatus Odinarchaeota archaeon]
MKKRVLSGSLVALMIVVSVGFTISNPNGITNVKAASTARWSYTFGGTEDDAGRTVVQTSDGGYAIAGWTESYGAGGSDI